MKKKTRVNFRCSCDYECQTRDQLIAHCRREHRDNGWCLWDAIGTTGDDFADTIAKRLQEDRRETAERLRAAEARASGYDKLVERWNALTRAMHIGNLAMEEYRQRFEKDKG